MTEIFLKDFCLSHPLVANSFATCNFWMSLRDCLENTMTFMMKKKKFKFLVEFSLVELNNVPFVNAVLFAKIRLLDGGGSFSELSPRVSVANHHIKWNKSFQFTCRITSSLQTGVLEPRMCRVSIRKELKGGRSFQKLGFCDINLAEYAGSGVTGMSRSYLLEGYVSGRQRQDNSLLTVNVTMTLQSSDPFFKVPSNVQSIRSDGCSLLGGSDSISVTNASLQFLNPSDRRAAPSGSSSSFSTMTGGGGVAGPQQHSSASLGHFDTAPQTTRPARAPNGTAQQQPAIVFSAGYVVDDDDGGSASSVAIAPSTAAPLASNQHTVAVADIGGDSSSGIAVAADTSHSRQSSAESSAAIVSVVRRLDCGVGSRVSSTASTSATGVAAPSMSAFGRSALPLNSSLKKRICSLESQLGCGNHSSNSRIDGTRVDANKLVDDLIKNLDLRSSLLITGDQSGASNEDLHEANLSVKDDVNRQSYCNVSRSSAIEPAYSMTQSQEKILVSTNNSGAVPANQHCAAFATFPKRSRDTR